MNNWQSFWESVRPYLALILREALKAVGTAMAAHGWIHGGAGIETFIGAGMTAGGIFWSWWLKNGQVQMATLLKKLTDAATEKAAIQIAKKMEPAAVSGAAAPAKAAIATDGTAASDNMKGVVNVLIAAFVLSALLANGSAQAQGLIKKPQITGNIVADTKANLGIGGATVGASGSPLGDILGALDDKLLPDLQYALKLATASGSKVTGPCYQAWIDIIATRQKAVTGTDGQPIDLPNPRLITDFEKLVELRNALQPDSDFMLKCSPVASMVRKDIIGFIGIVISGGAGLATLGL